MVRKGKIYAYTNPSVLNNYDDIHYDVLWYLLDLTQVNRCISRASLKEFLIRYLLITETDLNQTALNFINHGILIEGTIKLETFTFYVKDLIQLMGFSNSDHKYNIQGTLNDFIQQYQFKSYHIKMEAGTGTEDNPHKISPDVLSLVFMGLKNLLEIDSLTISFKEKIDTVSEEELNKVLLFVDFVMNHIEEVVFEQYQVQFPEVSQIFEERFLKEHVFKFDVFSAVERLTLITIYEQILPKDLLQLFITHGTSDEDVVFDLQYYNIPIIFAYGVKHQFIRLSNDDFSIIDDINYADFDIDYDELVGEDGEMYTTQMIYDHWKMEQWIHLLP